MGEPAPEGRATVIEAFGRIPLNAHDLERGALDPRTPGHRRYFGTYSIQLTMKITYLGHAGFIAETANEMVVMDPWLSSDGAFDLAWFQFPCNHHLLGPTIDRFKNTAKKVYVYISHIHQDHFDRGFLQQISPIYS